MEIKRMNLMVQHVVLHNHGLKCLVSYISLLFIHLHFSLLVEELAHCHLALDPSGCHDRDPTDARPKLDPQRVEEVEDGSLCGLHSHIRRIILGSRF